MTKLVVRRLKIDLNEPFPTRWNGGDAFSSALFNALSMSFPAGEQYFIDSVRKGLASLPADKQNAFAADVKGFIGQEATHRHLHAVFNKQLERLGLNNAFERRILKRIARNAHVDLRQHVGATAATEHFTAMLADWLLRRTDVLAGAPPQLQTFWQWHASEESEHRCTAFDIYHAMGGDLKWRKRTFYYVTVTFISDVTRQTIRNLWQDRSLFKLHTWRSAWRLLFAKDGMVRANTDAWKAYLSPDFHPSKQDDTLSRAWLTAHEADFSVVGQ